MASLAHLSLRFMVWCCFLFFIVSSSATNFSFLLGFCTPSTPECHTCSLKRIKHFNSFFNLIFNYIFLMYLSWELSWGMFLCYVSSFNRVLPLSSQRSFVCYFQYIFTAAKITYSALVLSERLVNSVFCQVLIETIGVQCYVFSHVRVAMSWGSVCVLHIYFSAFTVRQTNE